MSRPNSLLIAASILLSASAFGQWTAQQGGQPGLPSSIGAASADGLRPSRWASESFNLFSRRAGEAFVDDSDVVNARSRARDESIARTRERWIEQARERDLQEETATAAGSPSSPIERSAAAPAAAAASLR